MLTFGSSTNAWWRLEESCRSLGYSTQDVNTLQDTQNLLNQWGGAQENTALRLLNKVQAINRGDVAQIINEEIDRIAAGCPCEDCNAGEDRIDLC